MIKAVLFDFGGVLAEEGFLKGLQAVGEKEGVDNLFEVADRLIYETGYITGRTDEQSFWTAMKKETGIRGEDRRLREEILGRFVLRPAVIDYVKRIRASGAVTAILSDQTDWLDVIDKRTPFYKYFDHVFNSFTLHKGKRDPSLFNDVCKRLGIKPGEALFVDDKLENIRRASRSGMNTIHFKDIGSFEKDILSFFDF
jgi:putative hydrolase of the HAD superfamily